MARNKKTGASAFQAGLVIKVAILCAIAGVSGVGYINQKNAIALLGDRMKALETQREKLLRERDLLAQKLATLRSPAHLEMQVRRMNLGLAPVTPDRVVHMILPAPAARADGDPRLFAGNHLRIPNDP